MKSVGNYRSFLKSYLTLLCGLGELYAHSEFTTMVIRGNVHILPWSKGKLLVRCLSSPNSSCKHCRKKCLGWLAVSLVSTNTFWIWMTWALARSRNAAYCLNAVFTTSILSERLISFKSVFGQLKTDSSFDFFPPVCVCICMYTHIYAYALYVHI